ncbi:hypothetical protein S83_015345, partial [Arachis hypogaea]
TFVSFLLVQFVLLMFRPRGGWVNSSVGAVCGFPCYHRSSGGYLQQKCIFLKYILVVKVHIVYMGDKIYDNPDTTKKVRHKILSSLLGSKEAAKNSILCSNKHGFSGFAARLTKSQAEEVAKFSGVIFVIPNRIHKLHTTRSWNFLGIHHSSSNTVSNEINLGEGTIIDVFDTGIWPESLSFNDEAMGKIPSRWKGPNIVYNSDLRSLIIWKLGISSANKEEELRRLYRRIILLEPHFGTNAQGQAQEHPPHYHQHLPLLLDENADSPRTDKVESIQDRILPLLDELKETTINSGNENDVLGSFWQIMHYRVVSRAYFLGYVQIIAYIIENACS